jgi:hypothetical protein
MTGANNESESAGGQFNDNPGNHIFKNEELINNLQAVQNVKPEDILDLDSLIESMPYKDQYMHIAETALAAIAGETINPTDAKSTADNALIMLNHLKRCMRRNA